MYAIPDSIKAIGFYAEITIPQVNRPKQYISGIRANEKTIILMYNKEKKIIHFGFSHNENTVSMVYNKQKKMIYSSNPYKTGKSIVSSKGVYSYNYGHAWNYDWNPGETYPLLILTASDSASNSSIYSGYIFLPKEKKWKLIATRSYTADTMGIKYTWPANSSPVFATTYSNRWLLRSNNTWKALDSQTVKPPSLRPISNIDSTYQQKIEEDALRAKLPKDSVVYKEGIFYQIVKEGNGRFINVTDTIVVFYKGTLFNYGSLFDETKEKPATFPLNRLIKGWQLGVPYCKVGGKIRLYIPSGSAYGIRTFATDIPPNSTLVFDVEVLEAKEKL